MEVKIAEKSSEGKNMLYQIANGTVVLGGTPVLSHINFEIKGTEKIAVVGKNGAGKTTLLRLLAGELELERDDKRNGPGILCARKVTAGMLSQSFSWDDSLTVEEELLKACPSGDTFSLERFAYEKEYDTIFTGFGFSRADKKKKLTAFSGGEQTKIAMIHLLLLKPDILLLDEPTNHLDLAATEWLEAYLRRYEKAVVMVSHDRFFLDRTAEVVYELAGGKLVRYSGNYTGYREQKLKQLSLQKKAYERQQQEQKRLEGLVERFKHKPNKASFARAKKKTLSRMADVPKPEADEVHLFTGNIQPAILGSKWVFESEHLKIGYEKQKTLMEITMRIRRGQKIGILGANGVGKTTFLKTIAGFLPAAGGVYTIGNHVTIGYFDQLTAQNLAEGEEKTVAEHFHDLFPSMTEKEVRGILGAYLFGGKEASKRVASLSGGEKSRLVLAELLQSRPNFLILDEPTNHMDIQARETLESVFKAYMGTILFVSHDRYFIRQVAGSILIFENQSVMYYPFGYEHYLERQNRASHGESMAVQIKAEEQALIAGMRAVPKAEYHRLKEISTEEAYSDWRIRLAAEKMKESRNNAEELKQALQKRMGEWQESKEFWLGQMQEKAAAEDTAQLSAAYKDAWKNWHELCLDWYDAYIQENE